MGILFGGQTGQEKQLYGQLQSLLPQLTGQATTSFSQGGNLLGKGASGLKDVQGFFKTLLTGNRTAVTSELSPEIQAVKNQYDSTRRSLANTQSRSGYTAATSNELDTAEAGQIGQLFTTARSRGAQGLMGVSEALSSIGLGEKNLGASEIGTALSTLLGQQNIAGQQANRQQDALGGIGELAGTLAMLAIA